MGKLNNPSRVDIDDYLEPEEPTGLTPEIIASVPVLRKPTGKIVAVAKQPHVDLIIGDLYTSLLSVARRLREKSEHEQLDEFDFSQLVRAAAATVQLSKEEREKDKANRTDGLSEEELDEAILLASERRKALPK